MHALQKQIGIAVILFQRAVAQVHLVRHKGAIDALNHPIVVNIRTFIESALGREYHEIVEQHSPGCDTLHHAQLAGALQYPLAGPGAGVRFPRQHPRYRADRQPGTRRDFAHFKLFVHFVIALYFADEKIFISRM